MYSQLDRLYKRKMFMVLQSASSFGSNFQNLCCQSNERELGTGRTATLLLTHRCCLRTNIALLCFASPRDHRFCTDMMSAEAVEVIGEAARASSMEAEFKRFMSTQYSSRLFLIIVIGNIFFNIAVFRKPGDFYLSILDSAWDNVLTVLRFAILFCPIYIWFVKKNGCGEHLTLDICTDKEDKTILSTLLPYIQAAYPVMLAFVLVVKIFTDMPGHESLASETTYLPLFGLTLLPFATFFLIRDTSIPAMFAAWGMCVATLAVTSWLIQSYDYVYSTICYSLIAGFIFIDTAKQNRRMFMLMKKLQDTLKVNEKLAVEAQALELRAMIGNVAHDLKTPLTSLLSSIEYLKDVMSSWEELFVLHRPEAPPEIMQKTEDYFRAVNGCLSTMQGTNSFMTMTINRCLDYTKASKGFKLVPKLETVSLQAALEMPVQLMRDVQDTIEIQVLPLSAEVCLHVITDKQWLIENLLCLLSNAVKYSHKGCVQVSIVLDAHHVTEEKDGESVGEEKDEEEKQQMLRVEVQDTGIGLSDEAQKSLFNPFKQAQRLAGGTGLGLFSLAKRIEALQGQYGVSGRPDGKPGSLFWFTIPFRPDNMCFNLASRSDSSTIFAPPTPSDSPSFSIRKRAPSSSVPFLSPRAAEPPRYNVLVVDDAPLIVKMTTMLLQRKGHTVQHAVNGADALEKLLVRAESVDEEPEAGLDGSPRSSAQELPAPPQFDVVLMDLQMPVLDGIEAIRRLRAAEARRDKVSGRKRIETDTTGGSVGGDGSGSGDEGGPPQRQCVIALSANSDEETRQEALAAGADLFIPKPFTYESFIDAVGSLVRAE